MRFIVIDGLDGSGKDTQAVLIEQKYLKKGNSVILRSHPSNDNPYGIKAKKALLKTGKLNKIKASFYYALDVIRSVRKYYGKADTVIFVRYLMGVAYLPFPLAKLFYKLFETTLPTSKYMFFLDVEPSEALKRLQSRDDNEMFENLEDLIRVRKKVLKLAKGWNLINATQNIDDVNKEINSILDSLDKN
ncbi:thymidylate kinase [Methanobacterium sp. ACI-7]|uniref:thymidylate kinase n=1 Tax=unclassified Methanobacterium TaxID=2627676 RepID=UPI0039C180D6